METTFDFSVALNLLKDGKKVARDGWNGKIAGLDMRVEAQYPTDLSKMKNPYLFMGVGDEFTPWNPSQLDLFADDWYEITN